MVSVLTPSVVDRGFEPRSGQTKDYEIHPTISPRGSQDPELLIRFKFMRNYQKFQLMPLLPYLCTHFI